MSLARCFFISKGTRNKITKPTPYGVGFVILLRVHRANYLALVGIEQAQRCQRRASSGQKYLDFYERSGTKELKR